MLKIYHNPRCQKSRAGLKFITDSNLEPEIRDYMKTGITVEELKRLSLKMNIPPDKMIRTQDPLFKELKGKTFNRDEWFKIISENPSLLQRPVIETKTRAIIAIPPEISIPLLNETTP